VITHEARQLLRSLNFNIDPAIMAGALNTAQRQMVGKEFAGQTTAKSKTARRTGARKPILTVENVCMGNMVKRQSAVQSKQAEGDGGEMVTETLD
jgi:hypothetical protein